MEHFPALLGILLQHLFLLVLAGLLVSLLLCYALQANADKQGLPASWMAWAPLLQLYPMVKAGGASFLHFVALVLAAIPAALVGALLGPLGVVAILAYFGWMLAFFGRLLWGTATRRGVSGWLGVLCLVPGLGLFAYLYIAFHDGPVAPSRPGMLLGLVFFVLPAIPQLEDARRMADLAPRVEELAAASEQGDRQAMARTMESMLETMREMNSFESEGDPGGISRALRDLGAAAGSERSGRGSSPERGSSERWSSELEAVPATFACPEGTEEKGAAPPAGRERWCERGGVRYGGYASWYDDGDLRETGRYRDGERHGVWTRWFESGGKQAQAEFANGREQGLVLTWDEFGRPQQTARFHEGRPAGS